MGYVKLCVPPELSSRWRLGSAWLVLTTAIHVLLALFALLATD
jgi:hypothetical protein